MKKTLYAAAVIAAFTWSVPATAGTIAALGTTDVTVDEDLFNTLVASGIAAAPIEGASAVGTTFSFDITGGDLNALTIEHSGGVEFSTATASLSATNFLIDGGAGIVSGNVNGGTDFIPLFDLAAVSLEGPITADLIINDILSNAIVDTFLGGDPETLDTVLSGARFAGAVTSPQPVPLPASALLLIAGIGGLGVLRRRKAAS